jgi:hypothetical protein
VRVDSQRGPPLADCRSDQYRRIPLLRCRSGAAGGVHVIQAHSRAGACNIIVDIKADIPASTTHHIDIRASII